MSVHPSKPSLRLGGRSAWGASEVLRYIQKGFKGAQRALEALQKAVKELQRLSEGLR